MLTKMKLALVLGASLVGGVAVAQGFHGGDKAGVIEKYDTNKDGKLDDQEKAAMRADFQAKRGERKAKMLERFDTNKDGKLDEGERKVMRDTIAAEMFKKIDADGNGSISLDEFKAAGGRFAKHHPGAARAFKRGMIGGDDGQP